jgi:hypothetical protein
MKILTRSIKRSDQFGRRQKNLHVARTKKKFFLTGKQRKHLAQYGNLHSYGVRDLDTKAYIITNKLSDHLQDEDYFGWKTTNSFTCAAAWKLEQIRGRYKKAREEVLQERRLRRTIDKSNYRHKKNRMKKKAQYKKELEYAVHTVLVKLGQIATVDAIDDLIDTFYTKWLTSAKHYDLPENVEEVVKASMIKKDQIHLEEMEGTTYQIGDIVDCKDFTSEIWVPGIITSLNPLAADNTTWEIIVPKTENEREYDLAVEVTVEKHHPVVLPETIYPEVLPEKIVLPEKVDTPSTLEHESSQNSSTEIQKNVSDRFKANLDHFQSYHKKKMAEI